MTNIPKNLNTILHIGAGECEELPGYLASNASRILLVEPNPGLAARLRSRTGDDARVEVVEVAVSDRPDLSRLTEYNLPEAASLYPPTGLKELYPGLRVITEHSVTVWAPDKLFEEYPLKGNQNLLVVQAPGAELTIFKALVEPGHFDAISHIWFSRPQEPHCEDAGRASDVLTELRHAGYQIEAERNKNSDWPRWQMGRDPMVRKNQEISELKEKNRKLATENNDIKARQKVLEEELCKAEAQIELIQELLLTEEQAEQLSKKGSKVNE